MQNNSSTFGNFATPPVERPKGQSGRRFRTIRSVRSRQSADSKPKFLPTASLATSIPAYIKDRGLGSKPIAETTKVKKQDYLSIFQRWAENSAYTECSKEALIDFFTFLNESHNYPNGRYNDGRKCKPLRPSTINTHFRELRTFFKWIVQEGKVKCSPMDGLPVPAIPKDQIQPMTAEQVERLLEAAKRSRDKKRNIAIISVLFDSGVRASELCALQVGDIDFENHRVRVTRGKGNKLRIVSVDRATTKAIWDYLRENEEDDSVIEYPENQYIFYSQRGQAVGEPLQPDGLRKLLKRLGKAVGIRYVRVSPHTLRHTYAIESLRQGCDWNALQLSLGHENMAMTQRYVKFTKADLAREQKNSSPLAALRKKRKG